MKLPGPRSMKIISLSSKIAQHRVMGLKQSIVFVSVDAVSSTGTRRVLTSLPLFPDFRR